MCAASLYIWCRYLDTDQASTEQLAAAQTNRERSMLNITYKDRNTNIWVRERTKGIDIISYVRKHIQAQKDQHLGQGEDKRHRHNKLCETNEVRSLGHGTSTASKTTDGPCLSQLGDHTTRESNQTMEQRPVHILQGQDLTELQSRLRPLTRLSPACTQYAILLSTTVR